MSRMESQNEESASETDPMLDTPILLVDSDDSESSCEIRLEKYESVTESDLHRIEAGEASSLVDDQPQCRICLDIGGQKA